MLTYYHTRPNATVHGDMPSTASLSDREVAGMAEMKGNERKIRFFSIQQWERPVMGISRGGALPHCRGRLKRDRPGVQPQGIRVLMALASCQAS